MSRIGRKLELGKPYGADVLQLTPKVREKLRRAVLTSSTQSDAEIASTLPPPRHAGARDGDARATGRARRDCAGIRQHRASTSRREAGGQLRSVRQRRMSNWTPTAARRVCELIEEARAAARIGNHGTADARRERAARLVRGADGPEPLLELLEHEPPKLEAVAHLARDELAKVERACISALMTSCSGKA